MAGRHRPVSKFGQVDWRWLQLTQNSWNHDEWRKTVSNPGLTNSLIRARINKQPPLLTSWFPTSTLWMQSFLYPSGCTEIIFYKPSPGTKLFFQCLLFGTDFFHWYSCFSGWELKLRPYLQYRVSVYTQFLKWRTRKFNFRSYVLNLLLINISFCLSKVDSPGIDLSASHF